MTDSNSLSDLREIDYRIHSLYPIIDGLNASINELTIKYHEIDWYDGIWLKEESEPIYGLAFIAFQNYVNGTIKDVAGTSANKQSYYRLEPSFENYSRSKVELIIGLANYCKHKDDDGPLFPGTHELLESFDLATSKDADIIHSSPIFEGLTLLNDSWDLFEIINIIKDWRANLLKVAIYDKRT